MGDRERRLAAVAVGGCVGALTRAGVLETLGPDRPGTWPWVTFCINIIGAVVLGVVVARTAAEGPRRALLATGFCGALTTFSAMQLELLELLDADRPALALVYASASVLAGVVGVTLAQRDITA